ncbi:MAG TPA: hypothetical protein VMT54_05500 [Candidatus Cybelea sp.]|nr:hypothetical protein [Candidatus Cybelea sp.]
MLTRRDLLNGTLLGGTALLAGTAAARAFSIEPMPADVAAAYALRCSTTLGHGQLIQTTKTALDAQIAKGLKPVGAQEIVVCPICGCKIVVSA